MIFFLDFCPFLGEQHQPVRCFEVDVGVVDESLCDPDSRPEDRHRKCKNMDCPARSEYFIFFSLFCHSLYYYVQKNCLKLKYFH